MITFQREPVLDVQHQITPLFKKHWQEIANYQDQIPLDPNWDMYDRLEQSEILHAFMARDNGLLIGYFWLLAVPHLHYRNHVFAHADLLFLDKPYRKGFTALKFIKFAQAELKKSGIKVMSMNTKINAPFDALLKRAGFKLVERIYSKNLGIE
tara:strand:- start:49 stop:507 length:459 start_codon:yes stop_codon:yes gene_type:complete